MAAVTTS